MQRSLVGLVSLLAACDPGDVELLVPEASSGTPTLFVHAIIDTPYTAIGVSLGWTAGIPGGEIRVHLMAEPYDSAYWHAAAADSLGNASLTGLLPGLYEVEVAQTLKNSEVARAGGAVHLLAGGRRVYLPASGPVEVTTAPDLRGALAFSEFGLATPPEWQTGGGTYPDATYIEIYNNADTTIYLDHMLLGAAFWSRGYSYMPCAQTEAVRNDPDGIWTQYTFRFPGSGRDHPVTPGNTVLIAKSAIDHRAVLPTLPDLSHADFELGGYQGADNPDVPNLEDIGVRPMGAYSQFAMPAFLGEPVELGSLPRYIDPYTGHLFVRIPRAQILDARSVTFDWATPTYDALSACLDDMNRAFERLPGPGVQFPSDFEGELTLQRRVLLVGSDGRKRLLDTNTSMFDFVKAPRTPGWIP